MLVIASYNSYYLASQQTTYIITVVYVAVMAATNKDIMLVVSLVLSVVESFTI